MRPGELRALRWGDVDLARALVVVRRTMTLDRQGRSIVGETTKTGRPRPIALAPLVVAALGWWRAMQPATAGEHVFDRGSGGPLPLTTWQDRHERLIRETGVRRITLHELRHTFATLMLERGVHLQIVAEIMGHSSLTMTQRYGHVTVALQQATVETFADSLFPASHATTSGALRGDSAPLDDAMDDTDPDRAKTPR